MPNDLESQLINGGVSPAAAKAISNALGNLSTNRVSTGRTVEDATPVDKMRLISSDTRRYLLTNLDYGTDKRMVPSAAYASKDRPHPYQDSQPASANPTINTPVVKAGKYVSVSPVTANSVAQSEVTLRVASKGGLHARLNPATGEIEAVPFLIEVAPKNRLEATVEERPDATVIRLRFLT